MMTAARDYPGIIIVVFVDDGRIGGLTTASVGEVHVCPSAASWC